MDDLFIELSGEDGHAVRIEASAGSLVASTVEALDGWYSTPDSKVESTSRQAGHGSYPVPSASVLYSSRTVTVDLLALGLTRGEVLAATEAVQRLAGQSITLRVADGGRDTYAVGYIETGWEPGRYAGVMDGTVTVVCPDPRRYSTEAHTAALMPLTADGMGIVFDGDSCLKWPVQFAGDAEAGNSAVLANDGTSTAYPVITVQGLFPDGFTVTDGAGADIVYGAPVSYQPVVLDCMSRTASINGVDVTRNLSSRRFPTVEPGGSVMLRFVASGAGTCGVEVRDTYI